MKELDIFFVLSAMQSSSGSEGAIREAGGAFGKKEAAQEEQYFRKLVSLVFERKSIM